MFSNLIKNCISQLPLWGTEGAASECQCLWLLCSMRVFVAGIYKQFLVHLTTKAVLGKHSFYGSFHDHLGATFQQVFCNLYFLATRVTSVVHVFFLVHFVTGQFNLIAI